METYMTLYFRFFFLKHKMYNLTKFHTPVHDKKVIIHNLSYLKRVVTHYK